MVYAFVTPFPVNNGLETCRGTKSSVFEEVQPITEKERARSARQRPGKFAFAPAESALNAPSHPTGIGEPVGGVCRPFAFGTCNRSPLRVRLTICWLGSVADCATVAGPSPSGGAIMSIATTTAMPARIQGIKPRIDTLHHTPANSAACSRDWKRRTGEYVPGALSAWREPGSPGSQCDSEVRPDQNPC